MKKNGLNFLIITIFAIISMLPLITMTNIQGHDTTFHLANIEVLTESLDNTILPQKIVKDIANNFGYGIHIFYPSLPHYTAAYTNKITNIIGFTTFDTMALLYTLISIVSGILLYNLAQKISNNNLIALTSSIIYLFIPYRLGDIIVRSAYNEVFTFLFIPIILLSLFELISKNRHNKKFFFLFVIGYTGLLYSHLSIALYFTLFLIPFIIIYRQQLFKKTTMLRILKAITTVTLLVLPMLIPIIEHKILGNYLVFKENYLTGLIYLQTFNNTIYDYLIPQVNYSWEIPMYINIIVIVMLLLTTIILFKNKNKDKKIIFLTWFSLCSFIVSLSIFPWEYMPSFFYMIQFSWRCQTFLAIGISILAPLFLKYKKNSSLLLISSIVIILIIGTSIPLLQKLSTHTYTLENNINPNYAMGHSKEYLPVNTYNHLDYFNNRDHSILIKQGEGIINLISDNVPNMNFTLTITEEPVVIELPRLYYLGYTLEGPNKTTLFENENGFIEATLTKSGNYTLTYTGTTIDRLAYLGSLGGIAIIIIEIFKKNKKPIV